MFGYSKIYSLPLLRCSDFSGNLSLLHRPSMSINFGNAFNSEDTWGEVYQYSMDFNFSTLINLWVAAASFTYALLNILFPKTLPFRRLVGTNIDKSIHKFS